MGWTVLKTDDAGKVSVIRNGLSQIAAYRLMGGLARRGTPNTKKIWVEQDEMARDHQQETFSPNSSAPAPNPPKP